MSDAYLVSGPLAFAVAAPCPAKLSGEPRAWAATPAPAGVRPEARSSTRLAALGVAVAAAAAAVGAPRRGQRSRRAARGSRAVRWAVQGAVDEAHPLRVVIAGGGVGGLMTAKALSTIPTIDVKILEQANAFARFGGPIQLASNALSVIRDIDENLFESLMAKFTFTGYRRNGLVDALRTEWFCPFDAMKTAAEAFSLPYTGVVDRPDLQEILLDCIPEGTLENGKKVTGYTILPDNAGVRIACDDGSEMEADVLLGGDGIWSATRAQMWGEEKKGPGSGCSYSGYVVFAGETVYQPEDYFDVGYKVYMGPKQYFVCSDVGRGRIQWYAFCGVPEGFPIPSEPEQKKAYVLKSFFGWSTQIGDLVNATPAGAVEDRALYDRPPSFFKSWADGPVALMGDACHPMMPNLGQGGCQAMEDGHALMTRLRTVKHRSEVPDLLQDYYRSRIVRTAAVQFLSRIASDLLLDTFTFPWKPSEGLSSPYGPGKGDFNKDSVLINYLRYLLPTIFTAQFSFLYSNHPHDWTQDEVQAIVKKVMDRHRVEAHEAWDNRKELVERGEQDKEDATRPSFFAAVAATE